jgi:hypothetical protein
MTQPLEFSNQDLRDRSFSPKNRRRNSQYLASLIAPST